MREGDGERERKIESGFRRYRDTENRTMECVSGDETEFRNAPAVMIYFYRIYRAGTAFFANLLKGPNGGRFN